MKKWIIFPILLLVGLVVTSAQAQTEAFFLGHITGVGGRALSMGSAYLAVSDDYSATLWNPAGLTQLRRMELFASMSNLKYLNESTLGEVKNSDKTTKTKLNSIGFAFPVPTYRGSLVFAVGYNRVRNFDSGFSLGLYNSYYGVNQEFTEIEEGGLNNWVFAGAMEVTENLSIGASMNIWRGNDDYYLNFYEEDIDDAYYYDNYSYDQQILTKYNAVNFKLGALYRFARFFRFAATVATPVSMNAEEDWEELTSQVEDADSPDEDYLNDQSGSWDYGIKFPFVFSAGAAVTLLPNIVVSGDVEYTDWSQTRYTKEPPVGDRFSENLDFKQNYAATTTYRVGAEFTVPLINAQLRAGAIRIPSPLKDATSQQDRNYYTVGGGLLLDKQVKIDVAYIHGWWEKAESSLSEGLDPLNEKITFDTVFATLSVRF
ncbi:MAG: OmpP1/FadL family transporter [Candidatus Zhuqueibacterota bacterium]